MDMTRTGDGYILERSRSEAERLRAQARIIGPHSERVLRRAGIAPGMRCLDAGCGTGEGMRILGRLAGPRGHVTGLDIDAGTGRRMLATLLAEEGPQFAFLAGDITAGQPVEGAPFDLVFARLLLIHMTDPVGTVRRLWSLLRPGGRLVLVDYDLGCMAVRPAHAAIERGIGIVAECFRRSGKHVDAGLRLVEYLLAAGLPEPEGYDLEPSFGAVAQVGPRLDAVLASLAPAAQALGIASPEEVAQVRRGVRAAMAAGGHAVQAPSVVGVWTTRPN